MSRIIISDVHGCIKTMKALISKLPPGIPLTFAGDLIDRGPDSRAVIEFIKNGKHDCILGNHETMMLEELFFTEKAGNLDYHTKHYQYSIWLMNGGDKCLDSYADNAGTVNIKQLKEHYEWLKNLPYFIHYEDLKDSKGNTLLVTHSTAAKVWSRVSTDSDHFKDCVTWERTPNPKKISGIYNVYGHTPQTGRATVKEHFACIDTGAAYKRAHYGKLTALEFPSLTVYEQENIE